MLLLLLACSDYEVAPSNDVWPPGAGDPDRPNDEDTPDVQLSWEVPPVVAVDLIVFGDTSGSMTEELVTMGDRITAFVERLAELSADWQLAAVTGPDGCNQGGILTEDDADFASAFAAGVMTPPGEDEVDEWGLNNVWAAVELSDAGECNEGLLRDEALLHAIFLSDEDDNSPGWDSGDADYWKAYTEPIIDRKDDASLVTFSAIAGPVPDGCTGAEPGIGYAEAVDESAGEFLSICDDWYDQVDVLAETSVTRKVFPLEGEPYVDSISVSVNGIPRMEGWAYRDEQNAVVFSADPPTSGDVVQIFYDEA